MTIRPCPARLAPLLCAIPLLAAVACGGHPSSSESPAAGDVATGGVESLTGDSIFDLDVALIDHDGKAASLRDLSGHVTVAAMVYTSCTSICLMITEDMKRLERELAGADRGVQYVLFSLDPGRDTPGAMRAFADAHRLDLDRWRLLAASEDGVRDLAAVLGVKYRRQEDGEIAHSAIILVIDRDGVVRLRQEGVGQKADALVQAVARARG